MRVSLKAGLLVVSSAISKVAHLVAEMVFLRVDLSVVRMGILQLAEKLVIVLVEVKVGTRDTNSADLLVL